jgi:hypothetical protein
MDVFDVSIYSTTIVKLTHIFKIKMTVYSKKLIFTPSSNLKLSLQYINK